MRAFALRRQWRKDRIAGLALVLFFAACFPTARADDAPAHRAARLSYLAGDVTVDHLDNTAGDPAQINMPLAEGSRLTTGEDGEAEVEFEDGSLVRLTPNSSLGLNVLSVDPAENFHTQMMVLHGLVYAKLRASSKYFYVVDAGGELITPVANATVRINLDQPPATISVFDGTVQVEHPRSPQAEGYKKDVRAGEMVTGDASYSGQYSLSQNIDQDSWDEWNRGRDQAAADAALNRTAARDNYAGDERYGWSDLDANGSWYDVPGAGSGVAAHSCARRRLRSLRVWQLGRVRRHRICLGVRLFVGLDAVSMRQMVVLERFWLGLVARRRLRAERMGFWQRSRPRRVRRQCRPPSVELSSSDATRA